MKPGATALPCASMVFLRADSDRLPMAAIRPLRIRRLRNTREIQCHHDVTVDDDEIERLGSADGYGERQKDEQNKAMSDSHEFFPEFEMILAFSPAAGCAPRGWPIKFQAKPRARTKATPVEKVARHKRQDLHQDHGQPHQRAQSSDHTAPERWPHPQVGRAGRQPSQSGGQRTDVCDRKREIALPRNMHNPGRYPRRERCRGRLISRMHGGQPPPTSPRRPMAKSRRLAATKFPLNTLNSESKAAAE